uniref:Uncharacterized protein n=1 Tax=Rhizophora mucronata TaxID=61149 RepID=A0A2P2J656_RHIMU
MSLLGTNRDFSHVPMNL